MRSQLLARVPLGSLRGPQRPPRCVVEGRRIRQAVRARAAADVTETKQKKKQQNQKGQNKGGKGKGGDGAITPRSVDHSQWYLDVIKVCDLCDYGPVRGTMVIKPYGYALWEGVQSWLDRRFKKLGVENCYFPQLIPMSFIAKEADHVEGFAPELAIVTKGGGKDLEEPLVVRPTSETIVNHELAKWVRSYRDLPIRVNQWVNVHRWEMRTRPFLRTLEFLWQEGHTAHATPEEAEEQALQMIRVYEEFALTQAAIPVFVGRKSPRETFAGADHTYTIEAMMGDGKALQAGTSHNLGQHFSKAFGIKYLTEAGDGTQEFAWQSCWGVSTRFIGGLIMAHGDDQGLKLPPNLAPIQVVIVPVAVKKEEDRAAVEEACAGLERACEDAGIRCKIDTRYDKSPGFKFAHWEQRGVPVRVEVGPKDVEKNACVVARRDVPGKDGKEFGVPQAPTEFIAHVRGVLESVQEGMLAEARAFRDENVVDCATYEDLVATVEGGKWARVPWGADDDAEAKVQEETGATLRCFPLEQPAEQGKCVVTGEPAPVALFAKAY
ncbi:unnamed protein product [Pedinophyceae sp. YPF-701]|nr:unnamed protein product [Pedinophyceae sp. YPF-701]